jgi:hypothetical protein
VPDGNLATVTYIVDGDTIDVAIGGTTYRVRYIGMDTPERGDYFFSEATEANRALVEGQQVILVKDVSETDRYGRLLRMCIWKTVPSSMPNWSGRVTQSSRPSRPMCGIRRCSWNWNGKRGRPSEGCGHSP